MQLDFSPAESTDVDINLKVKEKQVGTASAGAGYTAQSGLTGFLDLGHNNVLGNGQSLALHVERGARTSNYSMSFTEPWFRDTPTLLGISAFNTSSVLDLYNEKRVGGSVRVGRPLRWPDYSRGSLGCSLENVTINIDKPTLTAQDSIVLRGLENGQPTLTSSVSGSFLRNNANNPFYPTKGTRLSIDAIATGGLFGGAVDFHKEKVEGRAYLPSLARGVTTMVRLRFGFLNPYPDQNLPVPPYERFRMGAAPRSIRCAGTTITWWCRPIHPPHQHRADQEHRFDHHPGREGHQLTSDGDALPWWPLHDLVLRGTAVSDCPSPSRCDVLRCW